MTLEDLGAVSLAVLVAAVVLALLAGWFSWTAGRLDRMHLRCDGAGAALTAALAERRALALEIAGQPTTDPATAVLLADAAAREPATDGSWQQESAFSEVLRAVWPAEPATEQWAELLAATRQVSIARRVHNDLASTARTLRERRRVRWFRLAGHARSPAMISFDDEPPTDRWR